MNSLSLEQLIQKLEAYCAYQERCLFEIQSKLNLLDASDSDSKSVITHLSKNRFFDQNRFAQSFAQGKLRINKWGKAKIKSALIHKFVDNSVIQEALSSIEDEEYLDVLKSLLDRKMTELSKEKDEWNKKQKILRFLSSRGFEFDEIIRLLN
jgi:regulatory protein